MWIFILLLSGLAFFLEASAQNVNFGLLTGGSLTDDFRHTTSASPNLTREVSNASQWFMIGPTVEVALPARFSVEFDAIRRRIRSRQFTLLSRPIPLPDGRVIRSFGPSLTDGFSWQFSVLGKYRVSERKTKPFLEFGPSFLPVENRDYTGITAGSGVEIPLWRFNVAPTLRYTRWLNNNELGAVREQMQFVLGVYQPSGSDRPEAFGQSLSVGLVAGFALTELLQDRFGPPLMSREDSDSNAPVGGIMVELPLRGPLSVEVDGLYRPTHIIEQVVDPDGSIRNTSRSAFLTWEFPLLAKYRVPAFEVKPIVEAGPSFRAVSHANSENYSHYGVTAGVGVSWRVASFNLAPVVRYTHWAGDKIRSGREPSPTTARNQFELVVGFSF